MTALTPSGGLPPESDHSFRALLRNRPFFNLWVAQLLSQTAHNGIHYVELLMIARLTGSTGHVGLMILAFTLPAVLFSAIAGVVVDRLPKRRILVGSNVIRIFTALSYIVALSFFSGNFLLIWVYSATFIASAIAQFFAPAEGAMIPMLVGRRKLITANSLFNLTITGTQVLGLLVIFPFVIKLGDRWLGRGNGIEFSFALVAGMYAIASWLLSRLPADPVMPRANVIGQAAGGSISRAWSEIREGLSYIRGTPTLWVPMANLSVTATIAMILAMVAPIFAEDILRVSQEDAIYIFAPAGIGMLLGTFLVPRIGSVLRREHISNGGLFLQGGVLFLLGLISDLWEGSPGMTIATMLLALGLGLGFALIGIPAQTMLQERTPHQIRGRVFSVQFLLANMLGIPPMLFAGTTADRIGIPPVVIAAALGVLLLCALTLYWASRYPGAPLAPEEIDEMTPEPVRGG
jgi:MFS family permease